MAFMNQERKKSLEPKVKEVLKKYGIKGRLGVRSHLSLVLNIMSGKIDFAADHIGVDRYAADPWAIVPLDMTRSIQVNEYHLAERWTGTSLAFLTEIKEAMNVGNHDRSDLQSDYFDVGWYTEMNIGKWNEPYTLVKE